MVSQPRPLRPRRHGACKLGGATRRDGSLAYYFSEPIVENDAKGVGPLLLAYTEILAAEKQ